MLFITTTKDHFNFNVKEIRLAFSLNHVENVTEQFLVYDSLVYFVALCADFQSSRSTAFITSISASPRTPQMNQIFFQMPEEHLLQSAPQNYIAKLEDACPNNPNPLMPSKQHIDPQENNEKDPE